MEATTTPDTTTTDHRIDTPTGVMEPYRIARDTWVNPEIMHAAPGTVVSVNSMVITGAEPVLVDTGNELSRTAWLDAAFSVVDPADVRWVFLSHDEAFRLDRTLPHLPPTELPGQADLDALIASRAAVAA